jgi:hypothetical protein
MDIMKFVSAQNKQDNHNQAVIYSLFTTVTLWFGYAIAIGFVSCIIWKYPGLRSQKCTNQAYQLHRNHKFN